MRLTPRQTEVLAAIEELSSETWTVADAGRNRRADWHVYSVFTSI